MSHLLPRAATVGGLALLGAAAFGQTYRLTDLGTLGGDSFAAGINDAGQVTGTSSNHAFLYDGASMRDLGTLGGASSLAYGIDAFGRVVGQAATATGSIHAFIHDGTAMRDITPDAAFGYATAINDLGHAVGIVDGRAFLYDGSALHDIGDLGGGAAFATSINLSGQVVGLSPNAAGYQRAFLYSGGTMQDLGSLTPNGSSYLNAINDAGQAAGYASTAWGPNHAVLYDGAGLVDLGTLGGSRSGAIALNSSGWIVGESTIAGDAANHVFLYRAGAMTDLGTLLDASGDGWTLTGVGGINDQGWISAYGRNGLGQTHAVLLQPVPEPASMGALGAGALALGLRRRKRIAEP